MIYEPFCHVRRQFKRGLQVLYDAVNSAVGTIGFVQSDGSEMQLGLDSNGIAIDGEVVVPAVQGVQRAVVALSSAEILALNTSPKTVIAAPGAGKFVVVEGMILRHEGSGNTAYAAGGAAALHYTNGAGTQLTATVAVAGFWDQTDDETRWVEGQGAVSATLTPTENAPVVLAMATADLTTGDGPGEVVVFYRVLDSDNVA